MPTRSGSRDPRPLAPFVTGVAALGAAVVVLLGCMRATVAADGSPGQQRSAGPPRLVVMITVDQLRGDYLIDREKEFRHGLARLSRGAWFTFGFQDHAITETAPGHASVLSGRFPRSTGITSNGIGVVDPNYTLIGALPTETAASPFRFRGTTLVDWLTAKDRRTKALSVSMKDRGAILPIGRSKQDVYWYSGNGSFVTSTYYRDTLPQWVRDFNARRIPSTYAGGAWRLTRDSAAYAEPDTVANERGGRDNVFPHRFPADTESAVQYLRATPMMDSVTALFALEGVARLELGLGPQTDVLAVSFSATDYIGHSYGPESREVHENLLRLDETIGWFLDSLYRLRDSSLVVVALTGDHGVSPIPELARARGLATGDQGLRVSLASVVSQARAGLQAAGVDPAAFLYDIELVGIDRAAVSRAKLKPDSVLNAFAAAARQVRGVARVDRMTDIRRADFALDPIARRWSHQIPDGSAVELVITLTRYSVWGPGGVATHGSPWDQDASVPIIFAGAGIRPGRYSTFARTVDIGPTLAAILRVRPQEPLDGLVLAQAVVR